jgi:hypothetical protein
MVAARPGVEIGHEVRFTLENQSDAAETITVAVGTGGTIYTGGPGPTHTVTVAQNNSRIFGIVFSNVTPGSEAYDLYNRGGFAQ